MLGDETFETEVNIEDWDLKREAKKVKIKWQISFEARSWGIKSLYISVPEQKVEVCWKYDQDNADGSTRYEDAELLIKDCQYDFTDGSTFDGMICPQSLLIDDEEMKLEF